MERRSPPPTGPPSPQGRRSWPAEGRGGGRNRGCLRREHGRRITYCVPPTDLSRQTSDRLLSLIRIAGDPSETAVACRGALEQIGELCAAPSRGDDAAASVRPSLRADLLEMGCADAVRSAMRGRASDPAVQGAGCAALGGLFSDRGAAAAAALTEEDVAAVTEAMRAHPRDRGVQRRGCKALVHLTCKTKTARVADERLRDGIGVIIGAMQTHPSDLEVQVFGLCALLNLSKDGPFLQAVAAAGGPRSIVSAIGNHTKNKTICNAACFILSKLSGEGGDCAQAVREVPDAATIVIGAMSEYLADPHVQGDGCKILCNLSSQRDSRENMLDQGGLDVTISAMKQNVADEEVQICGLGVLRRLLSNKERATSHEKKQDALGVAMDSMKASPLSECLQMEAVKLLWALSVQDTAAARSIAESGGVSAVISAARQHKGSATMQEKCFDAIHALAADPLTCSIIGENGGVDLVLEGMVTHITERLVQEAGVSALRALSADVNCKALIEKSNGLRKVLMAMKVHTGKEFLQGNALATICKLGTADATEADVEDVVESMVAHEDSASVQKWGCQCLLKMSKSSTNLTAIRHCSRMARVLMVLKKKSPQLANRLMEVLVDSEAPHTPLKQVSQDATQIQKTKDHIRHAKRAYPEIGLSH